MGSRTVTARPAWTVGMLRAAIAGIPDEALLVINAPDFTDPGFVVEQLVTSADLADGKAPEQSRVFALHCEVPEGPMELRAGRARALTAYQLLAGQQERGPARQPFPRPDRELEAEP